MEQKMVKNVNNTEKIFVQRMEKHQDELRWLYMELYGNDAKKEILRKKRILTGLRKKKCLA